MNLQGIAIPFFTETQWIAARTVMEDGMTFHDNYTDFVQRVQQAEARIRSQGQATIRVNIEPNTFAQWCRDQGRKVNAESRSTYAAMVAAKNDTSR